jgi:hypothetical protein
MATISPEIISDTTRASKSINVTITATPGTGMPPEIISSVTATLDAIEPGVTITSRASSVSIVGTYKDPFEDFLTYVERGSSNLLETPKVVKGISNLPPQKDFYELNQDRNRLITKTYTITVNFESGAPQTFTLTQDILNDLEGMRSFVSSYYE